MYTDEFGCILSPFRATWQTGAIEPLPDFDTTKTRVEAAANPDGYVYPPRTHTVTEHRDGTTTPVPRTERPAFLWYLPATHRLTLDHAGGTEEIRRGLGGFLIHFSGFLHGYRSQFAEWQIDGRLPAKARTDLALIKKTEVDACFDKAVATWTNWSDASRRNLTNALYFHTRAPLYEWDWERFQAEYQVLDAFYAVGKRELGTPKVGHYQRLETLCNQFGIRIDDAAFAAITKYRNALIHEVAWGEGMPGEGFIDGYRKGQSLRLINRRLGLAILGISAVYVRSSWTAHLSYALDLDS